jgi:hypothetical protein
MAEILAKSGPGLAEYFSTAVVGFVCPPLGIFLAACDLALYLDEKELKSTINEAVREGKGVKLEQLFEDDFTLKDKKRQIGKTKIEKVSLEEILKIANSPFYVGQEHVEK